MQMRLLGIVLSMLAGLGVLSGLVMLGIAEPEAPVPSVQPEAHVPAAAIPADRLMVSRDPLTGTLRAPTADEEAKLSDQAPARAAVTTPAWRLRDGGTAMRAPEHMTSYSVVRLKPDGARDFGCLEGADAAHAWVEGDQTECAGHEH